MPLKFSKFFYILFFILSISSILAILTSLLLYINLDVKLFLLGTDFRAFYTGGLMVLNGVSHDFYTLSTQYNWQQTFAPEMSSQSQLMPFIYLPFVALPMAFLAHLPFGIAYIVYMLWNIALLAALCFLSIRILKAAHTKIKALLVVMSVTFLPILIAIILGQLSLILAVALLNAWLTLRSGKSIQCGLWLSLLLVRPHLIVVPLFVFIMQGRTRVLVGMTIGSVALFLISLMVVGWTGLQNYIVLLLSAFNWGDAYTRHPQKMHSWGGFINLVFNTNYLSGIPLILWLVGLVFAIVLLLLAWRKYLNPKKNVFNLQWATLIVVMLFTSPHVNFHDVSLLIVAGILVTLYLTKQKQDIKWNALLTFLLFLGYFLVSITLITEVYLRLQVSVLFMMLALVLLTFYIRKLC